MYTGIQLKVYDIQFLLQMPQSVTFSLYLAIKQIQPANINIGVCSVYSCLSGSHQEMK